MKIKLNEEIIEYCKILKLKGIRTHFEEVMNEATDYEDFLHKLLTYEMEEKDKRSIDCRIRNAHLPYRQYFEDIEMDCLPVDMQKLMRWKKRTNVPLTVELEMHIYLTDNILKILKWIVFL